MDSRYECPICLNYLEDAVLTSCGHRFCLRCINLWLEQKGASCPVDMSPLTQKDIFPDNFTRREIVQFRVCSTKEGCVQGEERKREETCGGHDPLVAALYERIILLEQRAHEQDIVVENLRRKVGNGAQHTKDGEEETALRCCRGLLVWRITGFSAQLQLMKASSRPTPPMLYSPRFYTRPFGGYRFCVRLNLSPRSPNHLSLVVHVVRGDYDDILPWPFSGRISLELVNRRVLSECVREVVLVGGEGAPRAFGRPPLQGPPINPRGFGYVEFVALSELTEASGLLVDDTLVLKVHVVDGVEEAL
ncbi:TNF receptor-associated factor 6-like isoform X2 [Ischnura elegans]|nr:TNF receptor-associated factor 6-like isoform X2 [Ischnura elegans]